MNVAEKDEVISGMLQDEMERCIEAVNGLKQSASGLPRGVINLRKRLYKDKEYHYHCLIFRDGKKVINKHIPKNHLGDVAKALELRGKYEDEIRSYKSRIKYLHKLMRVGGRQAAAS
jgi:hypothetical protein